MATQTFTSSSTWQTPAGVNAVQVECWGSGGHGGWAEHTEPGPIWTAGGGGGGGAYAKTNAVSIIPGKTYAVTVGTAGGTTLTSFTGELGTSCIADHGTTAGPKGWNEGAGGLVANCIGDTKIAGGKGGQCPSPSGGGGGGCAGNDGFPSTGALSPGAGGSGGYGGGNGGSGGDFMTAGFSGIAPGGGGGGNGYDVLPPQSNGTAGQMKLTWTAGSNMNVCMVA